MELSPWANHPKDQPSLKWERVNHSLSRIIWGFVHPAPSIWNSQATFWCANLLHYALMGETSFSLKELAFNSQRAPHVNSFRGHIVFGSHGVILLTAFPAFTLSSQSVSLSDYT